MRNWIVVAAGIFGMVSLGGVAGGQETHPAPLLFRSDVRMAVYVYDAGQAARLEIGRTPGTRPIEIPAGREWEVVLTAADFATAQAAVVAQLTELGRRKLCPAVQLTEGATDADVEALTRIEGLTSLAITAGKITDKALAAMATMSGLREIRLYGCDRITPGGVGALAALPALTRLAVCECSGMANALATKLRGFPALKRLTLTGNGLDARCLDDLAGLKALESLKLLEARWLRDEHLAKIARITGLAELSFSGCDGLHGIGLGVLGALPGLKTFVIAEPAAAIDKGPSVSDAWLEELAKFPSLRRLHLAECSGLTEGGLANLQRLNGLEELELAGLRAQTEKGLGCLDSMSNLKSLDLSGEFSVTEALASQIARCTKLEKLSLPDAGDDGALVFLAKLKSLQELRLDDCPSVTAKGLEQVGTLAKLRVLRLGGCTQLGDAGLSPLAALTNLETLDLGGAALVNGLAPPGQARAATRAAPGPLFSSGRRLAGGVERPHKPGRSEHLRLRRTY